MEKKEREEMRGLFVQAAEQMMILNERAKISKKFYAETDALIGRLLKAAIDSLNDEDDFREFATEVVAKMNSDVVGWPKIDTP